VEGSLCVRTLIFGFVLFTFYVSYIFVVFPFLFVFQLLLVFSLSFSVWFMISLSLTRYPKLLEIRRLCCCFCCIPCRGTKYLDARLQINLWFIAFDIYCLSCFYQERDWALGYHWGASLWGYLQSFSKAKVIVVWDADFLFSQKEPSPISFFLCV
jgi:hypothetical protein